ncbi:MAG TPA: DUF1329 domain-containing protein, partial [Desulfuromonadales bacterium]|nr:DUF1329 domain-containing protein [Desulfuromonadales bacterium]
MLKHASVWMITVVMLTGLAGQAAGALSAEEAAKLGNSLTPLGGIKAGNAEGTIPAWEGGITEPPAGYEKGMHHPDPYAGDQVLFTVTADNMAQYADKLTAGHQAMLETYPDFRMQVYPSHRSVAAPQRIYDDTRDAALKAELAAGGFGVLNVTSGIPFPLPKSGIEAIWNHILRWRGPGVDRYFGVAPMERDGDYTMVEFNEKALFLYNQEGMTPERMDNTVALFRQEIFAPARLAGRILLVHETLDQSKENRRAWLYNPGQRRVRRAPNVA